MHPFQTIDWASVPRTEHPGDSGTSFWRTVELPGLRVRVVEYSPGYVADHWCRKGHIVHCLDGEFTSEMESGGPHALERGMTYVVSDGQSSHRSVSGRGATLLIIDGDFLKPDS
ncbi:MAG: hypothetical protein FJY80_04155 [Candidatus Aminicenantes bacterium]|nr:hypothetical protein [Candidatus Aminicenantes bacterium]